MSRLRISIPLLLSSLVVPAFGETATSYCAGAAATSPRCEAERARAFADARNAEIDASIAAVRAARAQLALSKTHCKTADSTTPRCQAERAQELALALTHCKTPGSTTPRCEAERARELAYARTHCKTPGSTTPHCEAERAREFAAARNAEINASIAAVMAERARAFAAARNAEINASIAAVMAERARAFAAARNAEINASIAAVEAARAFAAARNAEINASIATVKAERACAFAAARNAEIDASIAAVKAERARVFAAERNAEIDRALAAYEAQRALRRAMAQRSATRMQPEQASTATLETSAISLPEEHLAGPPAPPVRRMSQTEPCRQAGLRISPLQFTNTDVGLDEAMKPTLDRIAEIARTCPDVRIEIHGYSDSAGPTQINRRLSQGRARAAMDYLIAQGVAANRVTAIGHGDADPVAPNTTAESRAKNRRVEFALRDPAMLAAAQRIMWDLAELLDPTYVPALARLSP